MIRSAFGERIAICLLTRINVFDPTHRRLAACKDGADADRPRHGTSAARYNEFRTYCLPSVRNLAVKPDLWLLLFDERTLDSVVEGYRDEVGGLGDCVLIRRPDALWHWEPRYYALGLKAEIDARLTREATHLATFGLDDDDALHSDYLGLFTRYVLSARGRPFGDLTTVVDVPLGYVDTGKSLTLRSMPSNMFAGVVEQRERFSPGDGSPATVYQVPHPALSQIGEMVDLATRGPYWLKRSHFGNVARRDDFAADLDGVPVVASAAAWRALGLAPREDPGEAWRVAAIQMRRAGLPSEALRAARRALAEGPSAPASLHEAALCAAVGGDADRAERWQDEAIGLDPRWERTDRWLVRTLVQGGAFAAAERRERGRRCLIPDDGHAPLDCPDRLARAARDRPGWAWPCVQTGRLVQAEGRLTEAAEWFAEGRRREPSWAAAHAAHGEAALRLGLTDVARDALERAVALDPESAECWFALGSSHLRGQEWAAAADAIVKGMERFVQGAPPEEAFLELGRAHAAIGRSSEAAAALRHGRQVYRRSQALQEALERTRANLA